MGQGSWRHRRIVVRAAALAAVGALAASGLSPAAAAPAREAKAAEAAQAQLPAWMPNFVPDVEEAFSKLSRRPDGLAFHLGSSPDPTRCKHYQGMARYQAPDGTPYMFVTRSGTDPDVCNKNGTDHDVGNLLVIRLGSRDKSGERMRSNRLRDEPPYFMPGPEDVVVRTIHFNGSDGWPFYGHPGGVQLVGNVLAVALESPMSEFLQEPIDPKNEILFVDVSDPENPHPIKDTSHVGEPLYPRPIKTLPMGQQAGLVGIAPIGGPGECCRFVLAVTGGKNTKLRFYRTLEPASGLDDPTLTWEETGTYEAGSTLSPGVLRTCTGNRWPLGSSSDQSLNFVREGGLDGRLFLLGARNTRPGTGGSDYFDLWEVHLDNEGVPGECPLTYVDHKYMTSKPYIGGGDSANFAGASGTYVSPSGELLVYAAEFEDEIDRVVRFGEYRHTNMVRDDSPLRRPSISAPATAVVDEGASLDLSAAVEPAKSKAFITLYEDDESGESGDFNDSDQWVGIDYVDRHLMPFGDLRRDGLRFDNDAGSWRWFAPAGCSIVTHDYPDWSDNYPGPDTIEIRGRGFVEKDKDLDSVLVYKPAGSDLWVHPVPDGEPFRTSDHDDDISGVTFGADCDDYYSAPIGIQWDLDGDSVFETTQPTFSAAELDGPTTRGVSARAKHPTDETDLGISDPTAMSIEVRNVAPAFGSVTVKDGYGAVGGGDSCLSGLGVTLDASFTDPGRADTQSATVDWGDGTVDTSFDDFADASNGATGRLSDGHTYSAAGKYSVRITVTDDDGGTVTTVRSFCVEPLFCDGLQATIVGSGIVDGTPADDVIVGSPDIDFISGGGGNDTVCALAGNDTVLDGTGADIAYGEDGDDSFGATSSPDGADRYDGGSGTDRAVYSNRTASLQVTLDGTADDGATGEGDNLLVEGVHAGAGDDTLTGSTGANTLVGGPGSDEIRGLAGNDSLDGGTGDDDVRGGDGDDSLAFGATADGADSLDGGDGTDRVLATARSQALTLSVDGAANDGEAGEGDDLANVERLFGGTGDDILRGASTAEHLDGGAGDDTINGQGGDDEIVGDSGDDVLLGGVGDDAINGGTGADDLFGEDDNDALFTQDGVAGNDTADGGPGTDTATYDQGDIIVNVP